MSITNEKRPSVPVDLRTENLRILIPLCIPHRKVSQYSVRSNDDNDDDHVSYLSAAEEEPEGSTDDDNDGGQLAARASRLKRRMPSIARSRSENDLRRGDKHVSYQRSHSPYLAVPDQEKVSIRYY